MRSWLIEGMEDNRITRSSKTTEQISYELIETEAAFTRPTQVAPGSLHIYYSFQFSTFMGPLIV